MANLCLPIQNIIFGPKIGFDIFRFEDGLIVEHWDNLTPVAEKLNPAGRSQIDGTTKISNIELTEANKTLVKGFVDDVLMGNAPEKIMDYLSAETYLQHNTAVGDGIESLGAALGPWQKRAHQWYIQITIWYWDKETLF